MRRFAIRHPNVMMLLSVPLTFIIYFGIAPLIGAMLCLLVKSNG